MAHPILRNLLYGAVATLLITSGVLAQGRRSTMAIDDGETSRVLSWTEPNMELVMKPDVTPADVTIYTDELALSEAQAQAVRRLIDGYVESFMKLREEKNPDQNEHRGGPVLRMGRGPGPGGPDGPRRRGPGGPEGPGGPDGPHAEAADPMRDIIADELKKAGLIENSVDELPVSPRIEIGVMMGDGSEDPESTEPPEPSVFANVSFGGEDDTIDDAMRAKLQEVADKIAPRLTEMVKGQALAQMAMGMAEGNVSPDEEFANKWQEVVDQRARIEEFLREKKRLRDRLDGEVRYLLAEAQLERWQAFVETFTRYKTLALADLDGEGTDLIRMLDRQDFDDEQLGDTEPILLDYSRQMHQLLTRRNTLLDTVDAEIDEALHDGKANRALSLTDKVGRARSAIRDLNDRFMNSISAAMPTDPGNQFKAAVLKKSFPRVFNKTIGTKAFAQAAELDDLTDDQSAAVTELSGSYDLALASINQRILSTIRKQQVEQLRQSIESIIASMDPDQGINVQDLIASRSAIGDIYHARRELDAKRMTTLYTMLMPEQIATLPAIPTFDVSGPITAHGGNSEFEFRPDRFGAGQDEEFEPDDEYDD